MANLAPADARVSCPVCRAPVHPIAGRCKHCKANLVVARGGNTGAGEAPIAIPGNGGSPLTAVPLPGARRGADVSAVPAPVRPALPIGVPPPAAAPIGLSPQPVAHATTSSRRWYQRWPLLVAVVAAIAIVASLVMLLLDDGKPSKVRRAIGPAPDRMDTGGGEPPSGLPAPRTTPPPPMPTPMPPAPGGSAQIDPADPVDPVDPFDPQSPPGGGPDPSSPPRNPAGVPQVRDAAEFLSAGIDVGCERLATCGGLGAATKQMCDQVRDMRDQIGAAATASCTRFDASAAQACLEAIARFPCPDAAGGLDTSTITSLLLGLPGCSAVCGG